MKIKPTGRVRTIMDNPYGRHNYFGWPSVARLQNGRIAAVASGFRADHVCPFGKAVISYSEDSGETYTPPAPVIDTALDDRDCGVCAFGESGVIVTSFNNTRAMQREWLGKRPYPASYIPYIEKYLDTVTDEEEQRCLGSNYRISFDCGVTFGEIRKSPVTSPHGPTELDDGTVLWVGQDYVDGHEAGKEITACLLNAKTLAFEPAGKIANVAENGKARNFCEPHAVQAANGDVICHLRDEDEFTLFQSVSKDRGRTWSAPVQLLPDRGGAPAHLLRHSSGTLISAYGYRSEPFGVRLMLSADDGATWEKGFSLYDSGIDPDLGYPATVELDGGSLLTVFYAIAEKGGPAVIMQRKWELIL